MDRRFRVETSLMWLDKAATWSLADTLGDKRLVDIILEDTHTCYLGRRDTLHSRGYGCGECPACLLRKNGFENWQHSGA